MRLHGCNGRPPLKTTIKVQNGVWQEPAPDGISWMRRQSVTEIPVRTSLHCQYSLDNPCDPQCFGCPNQGKQP